MVLSDIEIANSVQMKPIKEVAEKLGIAEDALSLYGNYKAKISAGQLEALKDKPDGKLILVTAISPTPAGEGKTTTSVGLSMLWLLYGKKAVICSARAFTRTCLWYQGRSCWRWSRSSGADGGHQPPLHW